MTQKILLINDTLSPHGGAESYLFSLKGLLDSGKYNTKIIGSTGGISLSDSFFSRWYSFKYYFLIREEIKIFKPDIIHIQSFARVLSPSVLVAASSTHIPIIQTVHDYHYICPKLWMINDNNEIITKHDSMRECISHHLPKKNIFYSIFKYIKAEFHKPFLDKYVDHFICPSRDLAIWYTNKFGAQKISFVPNFVDELIFRFTPVKNYNQLLFVGRLSKEKGVESLIKSFALVMGDLPEIKLTIIGEGPEKGKLIELCKELNVMDNVDFIGKVSQEKLNQYYEEATAVVIPSIWIENCPIVSLEAIATGRPIICSDSGGLKDVVENNKTGFLFQRGNAEMLSLMIKKLIMDKVLINKINLNQKRKIRDYSSSTHLKKIRMIYDRMTNRI